MSTKSLPKINRIHLAIIGHQLKAGQLSFLDRAVLRAGKGLRVKG
jgi:hypothetical protein